MGRRAKGIEVLEKAKKLMRKAKSAKEIRICQAVIFPLEGLTLKQTAEKLGCNVRWVSRNRSEFIASKGFPVKASFLNQLQEQAQKGMLVTATQIHIELEKYLGRHVPRSSVYNLLHRNNWRKVVPNKRHVKTDKAKQYEWKKNSPK